MAFEILGYCDLAAYNDGYGLELDKTNQYIYTFDKTGETTKRIQKIQCSDMTIVDTLNTTLPTSPLYIPTYIVGIDETRGYLYVSGQSSKKFLKINLSTFTEDSTANVYYQINEAGLAMDLTNNIGYFNRFNDGTWETFSKWNLDSMSEISVGSQSSYPGGKSSSPSIFHNDNSYFGGINSVLNTNIRKVNTSANVVADCTITCLDRCTIAGTGNMWIDTANNYLYAIAYLYNASPVYGKGAELVKIDLSGFTVSNQLTVSMTTLYGRCLVYDENTQLAYIVGSNSALEAIVYVVNCATMELLDTTLNLGRIGYVMRGCLDSTNSCFYVVQQYTGSTVGRVWKIGLYSLPISSVLMYKFRPVIIT